MKKIFSVNLCVLIIISSLPIKAQEEKLTASQILEKVDNVVNAPEDQSLKVKIILIDEKGIEEREISMLQKGSHKRLVKFLSPASQKGIGVLSLPNDIMYLYLPAFKKTRRIASHIKNTKFAGTDFTYEDMEAIRYSEKYIPELLKKEENHFILQLKPKEGVKTDYSKLIMWVRCDNFCTSKIEYYDKGENLYKVMTNKRIETVGNYWISRESEMEDLKARHKTIMILEEIKFDSKLSDEIFTERYLSR
ncbi:MAG: outer membrane lipoprotein-sorting protein [candidate division WOR-3 bacterium]